jgi:3-hydroxyacyl-CoA dehydrogenase/enoyl-CoA hydratase/3-hydroxybutyryl-CoA epimerase
MSGKNGKGEPGVLSVAVREDGVALLTYEVAGDTLNTLRASFAGELERALTEIAEDTRIKAAVLVSGKADSFIVGADVEMIAALTTAAEAEALCRKGQEGAAKIAASPKPIVAAIHGPALGGGFEVALACQGRVLSDDRKTVLGLPEVQLGLLPGMNGLQRLATIAGLQAALEYGLSGKQIRPARARSMTVADDVVPRPILVETAARRALTLAEDGEQKRGSKKKGVDALKELALEMNPIGRAMLFRQARAAMLAKSGGHYPAPERILEVLETFAKKGFPASKDAEARAFGELALSSVARNLMSIFFATTAMKKDTGVDDPAVQPREVEKIAVLGAGLMGAGIAAVSIGAQIAVRLKDRDAAAVARGVKSVADVLGERVKKRQLTAIEREQALGLLTTATDDSGLAGADMVIEAVFEDLELKRRVLADVEAHGKSGVIFASNTSSIPIARIAEGARRPEGVVGMHYFSPVHRMPLLEVIRTAQTAPEVVATAVAVGKKQGKTVIVVNDGVGFYTSRILGPYMNEAAWLVMEGARIEAVDEALVAWGWPVGPMALLDEVGIDVAAHVGPIMRKAFGDRIEAPPAVERLVADGRKGRKNERGFYLYGEAAAKKGKGKHVDESVYSVLALPVPAKGHKPLVAVEEIQMRCSLQLVNEALHCFGEGILRSHRDGDIGAIFGLGFPPFRGGPFRYVDSLGAPEALKRIEAYRVRLGDRWMPAPVLVEMARKNGRFHPG